MAKSHCSINKRNKEIARKLKQELKRQRRFVKDPANPEKALDENPDKVKNLQNQTHEFVFVTDRGK